MTSERKDLSPDASTPPFLPQETGKKVQVNVFNSGPSMLSRRNFLLVGGASLVGAVGGGAWGYGEGEKKHKTRIDELEEELQGQQAKNSDLENRLTKKIGVSSELQAENKALKQQLAATKTYLKKSLQERDSKIKSLGQQLQEKKQKNRGLKEQVADLGARLLIEEATRELQEAFWEMKLEMAVEATKRMGEAVLVKVSDDAENMVDEVAGVSENVLKFTESYIVPLKEASQKVAQVVLPMAVIQDMAITAWQKMGLNVEGSYLDLLRAPFEFMRNKVAIKWVRDKAQKALEEIARRQGELKGLQGTEISIPVVQATLLTLLKEVEEVDEQLTDKVAGPIRSLQDEIDALNRNIKQKIQTWREKTLSDTTVQELVSKQAETAELLGILKDPERQQEVKGRLRRLPPDQQSTDAVIIIARQILAESKKDQGKGADQA
jgi:hypothetical protein